MLVIILLKTTNENNNILRVVKLVPLNYYNSNRKRLLR